MIGDEGFHPRARQALEGLIEEDVPLQVQHFERWRSKRGRLCGATTGQSTSFEGQVTCEQCKKKIARRTTAKPNKHGRQEDR